MEEEFGAAHGRVLTRELVVDQLGGRTPEAAIADGVPVADVWVALCRANDVPLQRWHGRGRPVR